MVNSNGQDSHMQNESIFPCERSTILPSDPPRILLEGIIMRAFEMYAKSINVFDSP